jgi:hypothetical protein
LTENEDRALYPLRVPPSDRFECRQDFVETLAKVLHDVIAIDAQPMSSVHGSRGAADEHSAWHELLQVAFCRQQSLPIRHVVHPERHVGYSDTILHRDQSQAWVIRDAWASARVAETRALGVARFFGRD